MDQKMKIEDMSSSIEVSGPEGGAGIAASRPSHNAPDCHQPTVILTHPRFRTARESFVQSILGLYEHDRFVNRLLLEAGRSLVFFNTLCLYAAYEEGDRATWPTMRLLQETMRPYQISSARRIHDIVARFVETGYLESRAAASDGRARILTPTGKALAHDHEWIAAFYAPLQVIFPEPGFAPAMRRDPAFQKAYRRAGLTMQAYAARLMADNPAFMLFMGREAGTMILIKLVERTDYGQSAAPRRRFFADVAVRFGISRTHVRTTLTDAEKAGLVKMSDQSIVMMPSLLAAFDRFVADTMAGNDLLFSVATRDLEACAQK
jgi:hypothetical protein